MIQALCVDWRKALRWVWSNQFPLTLSLQKGVIKFIRTCLVCQNNIVKIISQFAICNPMSNTGRNYRGTLDSDGNLSFKSNMNDWHLLYLIMHRRIQDFVRGGRIFKNCSEAGASKTIRNTHTHTYIYTFFKKEDSKLITIS